MNSIFSLNKSFTDSVLSFLSQSRLKTSITELSRLETRKQDQKNDAVSMSYLETEEKLTLPSETMVDTVKDIRNEKNTEPSHDNDKVKISSTTTGKDDVNAANDVSGVDLVTSSLEVSDIALKKSEDKIEESSSQPSEEKVEILAMDHSSNPDAEGNLVNDNVSIKIDVNRAEVDMLEVNNMDAVEENGKETFPLPSSNLSSRKLYEHVTETPMKVQDELEEVCKYVESNNRVYMFTWAIVYLVYFIMIMFLVITFS